MLLLHAISAAEPSPVEATERGAREDHRPGLRGYPLCGLRCGRLVGWATAWPDDAPAALGRADLLANHDLVMGLGDCLPARFPTWLANEDTLCAQLEQRQAELGQALDRLRGTCELALTLTWAAAANSDAPATRGPAGGDAARTAEGAGRRYLLARAQAVAADARRRTRALELREQAEGACGRGLLGAEHRVCPSAGVALSSALLVRRAEAGAVSERLNHSLRAARDVRILVSGPWPPYSFVDQGREA